MPSPGALLHQINNHWHRRHSPIDPPAVIFESGLETGNFSEWTSVIGLPEVLTTQPHHGSYSAYFNASEEYCHKDYTAQTTVYARVYIYITQMMASGYACPFLGHLNTVNGLIAEFRIVGDDLDVRYLSDGSLLTSSYAANLQTNTWYCMELKTLVDASIGEVRAY